VERSVDHGGVEVAAGPGVDLHGPSAGAADPSASNDVSWSPSMTQTGLVSPRSATVLSSSEVLPAPGELIRLNAVTWSAASDART